MKDIKNVDVNFDKNEKNVSNKNSENQKENIVENIEERNHYLQNFLFGMCFNEKEDLSYNISILGNSFFYFFPLEEEITNKILEYFSSCIKSEKKIFF